MCLIMWLSNFKYFVKFFFRQFQSHFLRIFYVFSPKEQQLQTIRKIKENLQIYTQNTQK